MGEIRKKCMSTIKTKLQNVYVTTQAIGENQTMLFESHKLNKGLSKKKWY